DLVVAGERSLPVEVAIGEDEPEQVVLAVRPRASIRGIVVDEVGQPVAVNVELSEQPGVVGTTSVLGDGTFTMLRTRGGDATDVHVIGATGFAPHPPILGVPW